MLDIEGKGKITKEQYESFWEKFLLMYSQLFNYKIYIGDQSAAAAKHAF